MRFAFWASRRVATIAAMPAPMMPSGKMIAGKKPTRSFGSRPVTLVGTWLAGLVVFTLPLLPTP
jgi:hypothetical protein